MKILAAVFAVSVASLAVSIAVLFRRFDRALATIHL